MGGMRTTKLIFIEGIPGSGKSTLAQFIAHTLSRHGIGCHWWYEEEKDHPLYVFHDQASLQDTVEALSHGRYREVIDAALERWKEFSEHLQSSESVGILDGCLFGYLTWSLFPLDIPAAEIQSYLSQVEQIMQPTSPCLLYLYQEDVAQALEKICQRRGGETRTRFIGQAIESPYGTRRGLQGFDGLVTYWKNFRDLIEAAFSRFALAKLSLENSAGDWTTYERTILDFLDLPAEQEPAVSPSLLARFAGTYSFQEGAIQRVCQVLLRNDQLVADGIPHVWPSTKLIPQSPSVFAVESLPLLISFEEDTGGVVTRMKVTGPELLVGRVDRLFVRQRES